jgi:hypothetical protein
MSPFEPSEKQLHDTLDHIYYEIYQATNTMTLYTTNSGKWGTNILSYSDYGFPP